MGPWNFRRFEAGVQHPFQRLVSGHLGTLDCPGLYNRWAFESRLEFRDSAQNPTPVYLFSSCDPVASDEVTTDISHAPLSHTRAPLGKKKSQKPRGTSRFATVRERDTHTVPPVTSFSSMGVCSVGPLERDREMSALKFSEHVSGTPVAQSGGDHLLHGSRCSSRFLIYAIDEMR